MGEQPGQDPAADLDTGTQPSAAAVVAATHSWPKNRVLAPEERVTVLLESGVCRESRLGSAFPTPATPAESRAGHDT